MYLKLMVRGLLRHRKSGKRLFLLLALCSAAILFFLAFRDSFVSRYQQLAVDVSTGHLQIVPLGSPKLSPDGNCTDHREELVLLDDSPELESFLASLPAVRSTMLAVETKGELFTLEGEPTGFTPTLVGVDTHTFASTLPGVRILEGRRDLAWTPGMTNIPVFRPALEATEVVRDNDRFVRADFRPQGADWERFKGTVTEELPGLFPGATGAPPDAAFLDALTAGLGRADLASLLPARLRERYDYRVDDALAALEHPGGDAVRSEGHLRVLRKRLLQAVYPEAITPVRDAIALSVPYTMAVPPAHGGDLLERPVVLPVEMAAYVQRMPLYYGRYYVDARVLRDRLGIGERAGTNLYVRLGSEADAPAVKKALQEWVAARHLPYVVRDYVELGRLYASTSSALKVITLILIVLFVVTVTIFIVNTVLLAVVKRRREIGTSIAVGLSPGQNILVMLGEMVVLVLAAWTVGSLIGGCLVLYLHRVGVPGIIFMPANRLLLDFRPIHLAISLAVVLAAAAPAALLPLLRLARVKPIDLLKEAA